MSNDIIVRRRGDGKDDYLEVHLSHDGDVFIKVKGIDKHGNYSEAQVEFCAPNGGGFHPSTIPALYRLTEAMKQDNNNLESPKRYKIKREEP